MRIELILEMNEVGRRRGRGPRIKIIFTPKYLDCNCCAQILRFKIGEYLKKNDGIIFKSIKNCELANNVKSRIMLAEAIVRTMLKTQDFITNNLINTINVSSMEEVVVPFAEAIAEFYEQIDENIRSKQELKDFNFEVINVLENEGD